MSFWLLLYLFQQTAIPPYDPADPEGLVNTPNGSVRYAFKRKVHWRSGVSGVGGYVKRPPPTAAEGQSMLNTLSSVSALFKATPTGSSGVGFWVNESLQPFGSNERLTPPGVPLAKMPHAYSVGHFPFYHSDLRDAKGTWRLSVKGETESISYHFNRLPTRVASYVIASEDRGSDFEPVEYFPQPRQIASWQGIPVYEPGILVVARAGRPLWVPVTIERVLKAALPKLNADVKTAEDRLADLRRRNDEIQSPEYEKQAWDYFEKNNGSLRQSRPSNYEARRNSTLREISYNRQKAAADANPGRDPNGLWYWNPKDALDRAHKLLASLTPETAKHPACWLALPDTGQTRDGRYQLRGDIVPHGTPGCTTVVMTNLNYFDFSLPRTSPQLLTIPEFYRCGQAVDGVYKPSSTHGYRPGDSPQHGCHRHVPMWLELDWRKFASLVIP